MSVQLSQPKLRTNHFNGYARAIVEKLRSEGIKTTFPPWQIEVLMGMEKRTETGTIEYRRA